MLADDGVVVPGQDVRVSVNIVRSGRGSVDRFGFIQGFDGGRSLSDPAPIERRKRLSMRGARCEFPHDARTTRPYWKRLPGAARYEFEPDAPFGLPFRPTPFRAIITLTADGTDVTLERPVQFRYEGAHLEGEKRMELAVVPRLAVRVTPPIAIVPAGRGSHRRRRSRSARHGRRTTERGRRRERSGCYAPAGWRVTPQASAVNFTREDESQTVRFTLRPAAKAALGNYTSPPGYGGLAVVRAPVSRSSSTRTFGAGSWRFRPACR